MKLKLIINPRQSKNIIRSFSPNTSSETYYTKNTEKEKSLKKERTKERNNRLIRCVYYFQLLQTFLFSYRRHHNYLVNNDSLLSSFGSVEVKTKFKRNTTKVILSKKIFLKTLISKSIG